MISGFLITTLILEELASTGTISLGSFLTRRARRLLPALALVLAVTLVGAALFWRDSLAEVKSSVLASALYVPNWWLIVHDQNYFASTGRPPPLQHVWSLAIEEQFYLLWPPIVLLIAVWLGKRVPRRRSRWSPRPARSLGGLDGRARDPRKRPVRRRRVAALLRHRHARVGAAARLRRGRACIATRGRVQRTARTAANRTGDVIGLAALVSLRLGALHVERVRPGLYRGGFLGAAALCTRGRGRGDAAAEACSAARWTPRR